MPNAQSNPAMTNGSSSEWLSPPGVDAGIAKQVTSSASTIRDLANLNIMLYDCATEFHSMLKAGVTTAGTASHRCSSQKRTPVAMDQLFRLTSEFIDVIKYLSREAGSNATGTGSGRSLSHVDEGTMLMIMSCHSRLTEIYLSIFRRMQACIKHSVTPQEKGWTIVLPRPQVGSHAATPMQVDANTAPSSATTSMYMLMVTMLSSQLCEKLANVMGAGDEEISGDGGASFTRTRDQKR